jgi:hypothetical protein
MMMTMMGVTTCAKFKSVVMGRFKVARSVMMALTTVMCSPELVAQIAKTQGVAMGSST